MIKENGILTKVRNEDIKILLNDPISFWQGVEEIGEYAFNLCDNLSEIEIPGHIKIIGDSAFLNCGNLKKVVINNGIKLIGKKAFCNCKLLERLELPSSVRKLGYGAFSDCDNLKEVKLNEGLVTIGESAFSKCELVEKLQIPNSVTEIKESAFVNMKGLEKVYIGDGVEYIPMETFKGCLNLKEVNGGNNVRVIGKRAFCGCEKLKDFILNDNLKILGESAFSGCLSLEKIVFPKKLTSVKFSCFSGCEKLKEIVFNDVIESIDLDVFSDCTAIEEVYIPKNINDIGENAFYRCSSLKKVVFEEGLEMIASGAFFNCHSLEEIAFPKSLKCIGGEAFSGCENLKNITLNEGLEDIGESAFFGCNNLENIEIPSSVNKIGWYCFGKCESLKNVRINEGVKNIGMFFIEGCNNIKEIEIPGSVDDLDDYAFYECKQLKKVILNEGTRSIGSYVFGGCESIESMVLPSSVVNIEMGAFSNCKQLKDVAFNEGLVKISSLAFNNCHALEELVFPNSLKTINGFAFSDCKSLKRIEFNSFLKHIDNTAFNNLENMYLMKVREDDPLCSFKIILSTNKEENINIIEMYSLDDIYFSGYEGVALKRVLGNEDILSSQDEIIEKYLHKYNVKFPYGFIKRIKEENGVNAFLNGTNFKNFKRTQMYIPSRVNEMDLNDFYTFVYNVGCFSKDKELNNRANEWVINHVFNKNSRLPISKMHSNFDTWKPKGENREFCEFLFGRDSQNKTLNFDEILKEKQFGYFLGKIYEEYQDEDKQLKKGGRYRDEKTNKLKFRFFRRAEDGTVKIKDFKPTVSLFKEYFVLERFDNVETEKDYKIAKELGKWPGMGQEEYEEGKQIMKEFYSSGIETNIVGKHLNDEIEKYKRESERLAKEGVKEAEEIIKKLSNIVAKEFTYEWLEKNDEKVLVLSLYCKCCAGLAGVGFGIMKASILHPDVQNLVINDKYGNPVAKSTVYVNREQRYALFNNVEVNDQFENFKDQIYKEYIVGVEAFVRAYNERFRDKPLRKVNVGIHLNDLEEQIKRGRKPSEMLEGIDFSEYGKKDKMYSGDWSKGDQYTLWEDNSDKRGKKT